MAKEPKVKVGDRFDKLTVVKMIYIDKKAKGKSETSNVVTGKKEKTSDIPTGKKRGWLCKCDCGGEIKISETTLLTPRSTLRSCNNCAPEKNPNYTPKKMTFEDNQDWNELYDYVRSNILGYDKSQSLPPNIISRLLGILHGKYRVSNKTVDNAKYPYKVALNTFKMYSPDIHRVLRTNNFKDEEHKFNYIAKIIENNINNVYVRMKNIEKAKEDAKNIMIEIPTHVPAEYKPREKKKDRFSDLW